MKTRNSELLASFVEYCEAHPQERFWQALRNWCGWGFVLVSNDHEHIHLPGGPDFVDTFFWEENRKSE